MAFNYSDVIGFVQLIVAETASVTCALKEEAGVGDVQFQSSYEYYCETYYVIDLYLLVAKFLVKNLPFEN